VSILPEQFDHVIGVDTHKLTLTAAVVGANGGCLQVREVAANSKGHAELLTMAATFAGRRLWAVEGTGSYGASFVDSLLAAGETVTEIDRPKRPARKRGKSDEIDALRAAREVFSLKRLNPPRSRGDREQLRILLATRAQFVKQRTELANQLSHLVITASETLRAKLLDTSSRSHACERLARRCLAARTCGAMTDEDRTRLMVMKNLARLIHDLTAIADSYECRQKALLNKMAPGLLAQPGVGVVSAAQVVAAWSHHGRVPTEAAFAAIAGVAPIPASSGQTVRHRLNPGGDRRLNAALHFIVLNRCRYHQPTKDYMARRMSLGKTTREVRRCLKRYLARQLWKFLNGLDKG